jgi:hypothetical protein
MKVGVCIILMSLPIAVASHSEFLIFTCDDDDSAGYNLVYKSCMYIIIVSL